MSINSIFHKGTARLRGLILDGDRCILENKRRLLSTIEVEIHAFYRAKEVCTLADLETYLINSHPPIKNYEVGSLSQLLCPFEAKVKS